MTTMAGVDRGKFIVFEGGDGSGKTTQARLLAETIAAEGVPVILTREPGGCRTAEAIREVLVGPKANGMLPDTEVLLHVAARLEHVRHVIEPALAAGIWVVCDRFSWSTVAYQCAGAGASIELVSALRAHVPSTFQDLVILIDVPVDVGEQRVKIRVGGQNRYDAMDAAYRGRVRQAFLDLHAGSPCRSVVIDGDQSIAAVRRDVMEAVIAWRSPGATFAPPSAVAKMEWNAR